MSAYSSIIIADAPISYWRLDETSGTTAVDQMGANNLTIGSSVTKNQTSLLTNDANASMKTSANGATTGCLINTAPTGSITFSGMQAFTVEYLIKPTAYAANQFGFIASNNAGNTFNFYLYVLATSGALVGGYENTTAGFVQINAGPVLTTQGNYCAVTWDGSANLALYLNSAVPIATSNAATTPMIGSMGRFGVGGLPVNAAGNLNGWIDEPAIYNYPLTQSQIARHVAAAQALPSMTGLSTIQGLSTVQF